MNRTCVVIQGLACGLLVSSIAQAQQQACGSLNNHYGPFDYRTSHQALEVVERGHFTPQVEALIRGKTGTIGSDIGYVLATSPNHHRALVTMAKLAERHHTNKPVGASYTIDCYFDRAIRFQPNDVIVRMIFADYLVRHSRNAEARSQLAIVNEHVGESGFTHYNMGLIYFDMKDYEAALSQAHKAHKFGYLRPELKNRLEKVGRWTDPAR